MTTTATIDAQDEDVMVHHERCSNPGHPDEDECLILTDGIAIGDDAGTIDWNITANPGQDIGISGSAQVDLTIVTEEDRREAIVALAALIGWISDMPLS
jgi:hypothetical protein